MLGRPLEFAEGRDRQSDTDDKLYNHPDLPGKSGEGTGGFTCAGGIDGPLEAKSIAAPKTRRGPLHAATNLVFIRKVSFLNLSGTEAFHLTVAMNRHVDRQRLSTPSSPV